MEAPIGRMKMITDLTELVPILRIFNTELKRKVFQELYVNWCSFADIDRKYGKSGKDALTMFEKAKLVEIKWQTNQQGKPEKVYRTYYTSFHINAHCPVNEISEILVTAAMPEKKFLTLERKIINEVDESGSFAGDVAQAIGVSPIMLKALVRRSDKLACRGHRVEKTE